MDSGGFPDSGKIGRITPTGDITFFSIPLIASAGTLPEDIVAGPDGSLWFTDRYLAVGPGCCDTGGRIGRVGNGTDHLVWRHSQTGDVAAWLMTGVTVTAIPVIAAGVSLEWQITARGDERRFQVS
jgi:hypothetical protein